MIFMEKLLNVWKEQKSFVCVGLDPDINKIPQYLKKDSHPIFNFNKEIIDKTFDLVCAYKPQIAYYSAYGYEKDLEMTIDYINSNYPQIPVILDAKRGDIGATAQMYVKEAFDRYCADAVTVNPYMGGDTLDPFFSQSSKGVVVLCRTSNPGSSDFQNVTQDGQKLYQLVAKRASSDWNKNNNILLVVGATYPEELKEVRAIAPNIPFLIPGIGAQGGDLEQAVSNAKTSDNKGIIINSSRGIIYASSGNDFADAARRETLKLRDAINKILEM